MAHRVGKSDWMDPHRSQLELTNGFSIRRQVLFDSFNSIREAWVAVQKRGESAVKWALNGGVKKGAGAIGPHTNKIQFGIFKLANGITAENVSRRRLVRPCLLIA